VHFRKLGRTTSHRLSLLKNLTTELIKHQRIKTTVAKAKELRRPAEKVSLRRGRVQCCSAAWGV